ncbi:MAG: GerMN domain-containing protein [Vulcanibacillus sp.]
MNKLKYLLLFSIFLFTVGCSDSNNTDYIKIYHLNDEGTGWMTTVQKDLPADPEIIINELITNEITFIPKDTKLLSFEVKDNIAYVNLSKEFENMSLGDFNIWISIYTIVNTLCLNEELNIDSVQFLIEGEIQHFIGYDIISDEPKEPFLSL